MRRTHVVIALAVLLGLAGLGVVVMESPQDAVAPRTSTAPAASVPAPETPHVRAKAPPAPAAPAAQPALPALPATADLASADRDLDLHGVVVRKDGTPIGGASLTTLTSPWERAMVPNWEARDLEVAGAATTSAADGTFRLRLARGDDVRLRAEAAGFATAEFPHRLAGERIRIVLEPGVRLVVRTLDESGAPLAAVPVRVFRHERQGDPTFKRTGTSGADGSCAFDGLPPGVKAYLECKPAGRVASAFQEIDVPATGEATVDVKLGRGRTLRGRVIDAVHGTGIAGAHVGVEWVLMPDTTTGADGAFELPGVPDKGGRDLHVLADGYGRGQRKIVAGDEPVEIALTLGFAVRGRIVDAQGAPVAGAYVSAIASTRVESSQQMSLGFAQTDAAGAFRIADLRRKMPHRLNVLAAGHARLQMRFAEPPAEAALAELGDVALAAPRSIEGRVQTPDGKPLARIPLELTGPDDKDYFHYGLMEPRATDDLGRFRFVDLPAGGYQLATKMRSASEATQDVTVTADADVRDLVLVLDLGREVVVTVVDEQDRPVPKVYVSAFAAGVSPGARTDAAGVARLQLRGTGFKIRASASLDDERSYLPTPMIELAADQAEMRLVLRAAAKIAGTLVDPDGKPIHGAVLEVDPADPAVGMLPTDASGRFSVLVPATGTYAIVFDGVIDHERWSPSPYMARAEGVRPGTMDLVVRATKPALDRALTVRVLLPDGAPASGVAVSVMGGSGAYPADGPTGADGRARFAKLPAKKLSVMASVKDDMLPPTWQWVTPEGQEIVLTMRRAIVITGVVVDGAGAPVKGAYCRVYKGDAMILGNDSKADGTFSLLVPADDAGPFRVEAMSSRPPAAKATETLAAGTTTVRLVLEAK